MACVTACVTVGVGRCFQLVVGRLFQGDQRVVSFRRSSKDLIEFALGGCLCTRLCVLDDEDHGQCCCCRKRLEHGLQSGRELKHCAEENPHHDGCHYTERKRGSGPVSYTHLTLPTKRIV